MKYIWTESQSNKVCDDLVFKFFVKLHLVASQIVFVERLEEQGHEDLPRRLVTSEQNPLALWRPLPFGGLPQPIDELLKRRHLRFGLENLAALHVLQHAVSPDIDHSV